MSAFIGINKVYSSVNKIRLDITLRYIQLGYSHAFRHSTIILQSVCSVLQHAVCIMLSIVLSLQCTLCRVQCMCSVQYAVRPLSKSPRILALALT